MDSWKGFFFAPLGVCSAQRRHQSSEWMILSQVDCVIQREVIGFEVLLDCLHPRSTRESRWSPILLLLLLLFYYCDFLNCKL